MATGFFNDKLGRTSADNPCMTLRWNQQTTLMDIQFDWENTPTPRPVRLTGTSPTAGDPARVSMGGAEEEGVIDRFNGGVLHVQLPKARMQRSEMRSRSDGRGRKAAKKR